MVDVLLRAIAKLENDDSIGLRELRPKGDYVVATIHRAENTDDPIRLRPIIESLRALPVTVLLPVHPRLQARASSFAIDLSGGSLHAVPPLSYITLIDAVLGSVAVATDSGGLQKEAYVPSKPTTTIRTETEWVETLDDGWNVVVPDVESLAASILRTAPSVPPGAAFWRGHASEAVAAALSSGLMSLRSGHAS